MGKKRALFETLTEAREKRHHENIRSAFYAPKDKNFIVAFLDVATFLIVNRTLFFKLWYKTHFIYRERTLNEILNLNF